MGNQSSLRSLLSASPLPSNEAKILMAYVLDKYYQLPRSALLSRDEMELNSAALEHWKKLESCRMQGEPIAYLVGKKGFHNIELQVAPGVLIPRPETELLVEIGLHAINAIQRQGKVVNVLDLGTGSGAIALAIAHNAPNIMVTATDQSSEALTIARTNAKNLGLESCIHFLQGNWFEALDTEQKFDVILSNPPYIPNHDPHLKQGDLRFEPLSALTDYGNGLACLQTIILRSTMHLNPDGLIAIEHGFDQSDAIKELMKLANLKNIQSHRDLAGHIRITAGKNSTPKT